MQLSSLSPSPSTTERKHGDIPFWKEPAVQGAVYLFLQLTQLARQGLDSNTALLQILMSSPYHVAVPVS